MPPSSAPVSPPLAHFLAGLGTERVWGQVWIRRLDGGAGFELRQADDRAADAAGLRSVAGTELRTLAEITVGGRFRPLKSAPTLVRGWRCAVESEAGLAAALQALQPGALADAWAWETGIAPADRWEDVVGRQAGRGRELASLSGEALAAVVVAGCHPAACLDRRCWTAPGVPAGPTDGKGAIPCLEPCGAFLAFAQACARTEQAATVPVHFAPDDLATLAAALRHVLNRPADGGREEDLGAPLDPRRVARLLERHRELWDRAAEGPSDADAHE